MSIGVLPIAVPIGAATWTMLSKSSAYGADFGDFVSCDTTLGGFTVTLPTAVGNAGKSIYVRKSSADGNSVLVDTTGGQTINGSTTQTIVGQYTAIVMVSDGANWVIG